MNRLERWASILGDNASEIQLLSVATNLHGCITGSCGDCSDSDMDRMAMALAARLQDWEPSCGSEWAQRFDDVVRSVVIAALNEYRECRCRHATSDNVECSMALVKTSWNLKKSWKARMTMNDMKLTPMQMDTLERLSRGSLEPYGLQVGAVCRVLERRGLVRRIPCDYRYEITCEGRKALEAKSCELFGIRSSG